MKKGGDQQPLLTDDELRAKLNSVLASGFTERGNMMLPATAQYNLLHTDAGLKSVFYDMCRWLGLKPRGIHVAFSKSDGEPTRLYNDKTVTIDHASHDHPYMTGALLAFAALMYYCDHFTDQIPDTDFIEFASIETGLGLWVINGLQPKTKHSHALYQILKGMWLHRDGLTLDRYTPQLYAHSVAQFAHDNHVLAETYMPSVSPGHRYLLPDIATSKTQRSLPEPHAVIDHRKAARQLWLRYTIVGAIIASTVSFGAYFWYNRGPGISAEERRSEHSLAVLKESLETCQKKAIEQQNNYDPDDQFLTRQIDATKNRCKSLLNEYTHAYKEHQTLYDK